VEAFGPENVSWRFSPVPVVPDVLDRFQRILDTAATLGLKGAYVSFLQPNDRIPETRNAVEQLELLRAMGESAAKVGVQVRLCREAKKRDEGEPWATAVCAPPEDFLLPTRAKPTAEGCGCVHMVDPFTQNESCSFGCAYCYAANTATNPHKRDTTKLPILRSP